MYAREQKMYRCVSYSSSAESLAVSKCGTLSYAYGSVPRSYRSGAARGAASAVVVVVSGT
jgi:hypothetical protein